MSHPTRAEGLVNMIYWPPVPPSLAPLLSRSAGLLNRGSWGPIALCWELVLTASNCNKLTPTNWSSCRTGLYHCLTSTWFLWASYLHRIQPVHGQGYTLISSTGCTCSLIDDWVGAQYVTLCYIKKPSFHFLFNPPLPPFLKKLFSVIFSLPCIR